MYIQVKLLSGWQEPLWYQTPSSWEQEPLLGALVRVPLQKRTLSGLVVGTSNDIPNVPFKIRHALAREEFPVDKKYALFLEHLGSYYQIEPLHFYKRMRLFIEQAAQAESAEITPYSKAPHTHTATKLTEEQEHVLQALQPALASSIYQATLLHGVTGSGKTEIYKKLIIQSLQQQKTVLLLLPEVTLALQFEKILKASLEDVILHSFHSGTSPRDKKLLWRDLLIAKPVVIIGVHLPVLLPISNLGMIIVDEEHEVGYQEKKHPKINTKEAALMRAHVQQIPILLGSATPSISSLYNVEQKGWQYLTLSTRFSGSFPTIKTVYLSDGVQRRNFWISTELEQAIKDRLAKKEQIIIFLNRRGYSFFVQCKQCSFIFSCPSCSVSLTLHEDDSLSCHYCDYHKRLPQACPQCAGDHKQFLKKGIGTQQVVTILEKLFPKARIGRADLDVTVKKKLWQKTLNDFESGNLDILVGTQTITKGLHFPRVTLVGILWADINVHFPIYNATETALQQLIQVAGRAGRQSAESLVVVQAIAHHPVLEYLDERIYKQFYEQELEHRSLLGYPPCSRLVEIELRHTQDEVVEADAIRLVRFLTITAQKYQIPTIVLGPSKPAVHKIKNMHMRKLYLKSSHVGFLQQLFSAIPTKKFRSTIRYTPNPTS